jgi:L-rhamnose mutarotase
MNEGSTEHVRYGSMIGIRPERISQYEALHDAVPHQVLRTITECNVVNYSIFRYREQLFSYYEYAGADHATDMEKMAADPETQAWWAICKPMQRQTDDRVNGQWWTPIPEVFHVD